MTMSPTTTRIDWMHKLQMFGLLFVCIAVISAMQRWTAFNAFLDGIEYTGTYNAYAGFDPIAAAYEEFRDALFTGYQADVAFTFVSALILTFMPRFVIGVFFAFLIGFYAANVEHVRFNLTHIDLSLLSLGADPVFLRAHFNIGIVALALQYGVVVGCILLIASRLEKLKYLFFLLTIGTIAIGFRPFAGMNIAQPFWLQSHPLMLSMGDRSLSEDSRVFDARELQRPTLPQVASPETRKNIIVLYLEGLAQASLDNGDMTTVKALGETGSVYTRYISHQLITANGLYSTLTGQLPRFVGPSKELNWFEMSDESPEVAASLPRRLGELGYNTAFIQSAPLAYMAKDEQLPLLGFDRVRGNESFRTWYSKNGWGVDDLTLFESVLETIDRFPADEPWMIATLTTGTHAPYNVPDDFLTDHPNARYRALQWVDAAVGALVDGLKARGLYEDTLVVITSDESRARITGSPLANEITLNWLPLILLNANGAASETDQIVTSSDLPWLILAEATGTDLSFPGADTEAVLFGNVISGRFFWYDKESHELLSCETKSYVCAVYPNVEDLGDVGLTVPERAAIFPSLQDIIEP